MSRAVIHRSITLCMALMLCISVLAGCGETKPTTPGQTTQAPTATLPAATQFPDFGDADALLTFCAMSDVHMGATNTVTKFDNAMAYLSSLKYKPEAYLFVGDLTDTVGSTKMPSQIRQFKSIYEDHAKPEQMVYCLGPTHDVPANEDGTAQQQLFAATLGDDYVSQGEQGIRHQIIQGFHFFSIDWEGAAGGAISKARQTWLTAALDEAQQEDPDKPIFVLYHAPDTGTLTGILRKYPQVVCFTGHVHNSVAREDAISQDYKYTSVHCGGMNYYRVTGYDRFYDNPYEFLGNIYDFGQALYVQVDQDNNVTIQRLDTFNQVAIEQPWVVGPDRRDVYVRNRRKTAKPCTFSEDSQLIAKVSGNDVTVAWDACTKGDAGPALYYQVSLYVADGKGGYTLEDQRELSSQQVFYPNDAGIPKQYYRWTFKSVRNLQDYAVTVTAMDCWQMSKDALVYTNGTFAYGKPADGTPIKENITVQVGENGPTLTLSKNRYEVGEDIVAIYTDFTQAYWGNVYGSIDIFKKGDVLGTNPSKASCVVWHVTPSVAQTGLTSGTVTYPQDDNKREGVNFPLAPGEYVIFLRADNSTVSPAIEFTVV